MQKELVYQNTRIAYQKLGSGKPVVLLHGFGENSSIWKRQIEYLQNNFLLLIPDIPGSGNSEFLSIENLKTTPQKDYISITDYADVLQAILVAESIEKCTLLGHSMGGYITLAFAEKYPNHLQAFGLIHSSALPDSAEKKEMRQKGIALMEKYGVGPFLKNTIPNLFGDNFKKEHPEDVAALIKASERFNTKACQQYYTAMMHRKDTTAVLRNTNLPTLFIIGTVDVAVPITDVLPQTHMPKFSYIHILEEVGHMGMWEATEKLNSFLEEFINLPQ